MLRYAIIRGCKSARGIAVASSEVVRNYSAIWRTRNATIALMGASSTSWLRACDIDKLTAPSLLFAPLDHHSTVTISEVAYRRGRRPAGNHRSHGKNGEDC